MSLVDQEMLDLFVQESREHLEELEPCLLTLEEQPDSPDVINRVFRSVHSIKGTSGFFGLTRVASLAHAMENLMSLMRDGEIKPTREVLDALLGGTDRLSQMVEDVIGSEEYQIDDLVTRLEILVNGEESAPVEEEFPPCLADFKIEPIALKRVLSHGHCLYRIRLYTQRDIKEKDRTPLEVFLVIEDLGEFFDAVTRVDEINGLEGALQTDLAVEFLFSTVMQPDLVAGAFDLPAEQVTEVTDEVRQYIESAEGSPSEEDKATHLEKVRSADRLDSGSEEKATTEDAANEPPAQITSENGTPKAVTAPISITTTQAPNPARPPLEATRAGDSLPSEANGALYRKAEETVRVTVALLDDLMNLAGEMVLCRNQLLRAADKAAEQVEGLGPILQNVSHITSDMQERVMRTRLQAIGSLFGKFRRIIRDLGNQLGKDIELQVSGEDVELDRSILEALSDPLTHLIRNCADHAIEPPQEREKTGKNRRGLVQIHARHVGGQVHIEVIDDGRGLDADTLRAKAIEKGLLRTDELDNMSEGQIHQLIFMPGFSTAKAVSDVSGRGVGMDVVRTNIEKLGGNVDLHSQLGKGTRICLKLPLTLAIIPAMIVGSRGKRFAVPQVNLEEIVRLGKQHRRENIRGAPVLRLRGKLLPLVDLDQLLYPSDVGDKEASVSRRYVLVLRSENHRFGLTVDELNDSEEIVVKPLSSYLNNVRCYSGATIMGDGKVAMILDATGVTQTAQLDFASIQSAAESEKHEVTQTNRGEMQSLLLFRNGGEETFALNLSLVSRIEKITRKDIQRVGGREYLKYGDSSLRLLRLHEFMPVGAPQEDSEVLHVIVPKLVKYPLGIIATEVIDAVETDVGLDSHTVTGTGILGSAFIRDALTLMVDLYSLFEKAEPEHYGWLQEGDQLRGKRILLAEDTAFFRTVASNYLKEFHCQVTTANDGLEAWELLHREPFDLLLTDIEMPHMNGFELVERVRAEDPLADLPIVALTSLGMECHRQRGLDAGVDAYEQKLDKERLRQTLESVLAKRETALLTA